MKTYIPAILVLLILALLVGAGFVTANLFASPEAAFNRQVGEKVEQAQRLLARYEGGQPLLLAALQRLSTMKSEPATQPATGEPAADEAVSGGRDLLGERQQELSQRRDDLKQKLASFGGSTETTATEFESEEELQRQVEANAELLDKALAAVRGAISESEGDLSGSSHPVATRLEAMLIYHQADLQRRQASVRRARSDAERGAFNRVLISWREADGRVKALQTELAGTQGGVLNAPATAPAAAEPAPAPKAAAEPSATKQPAPKPSGKGMLSALKDALSKKPINGQPAPETPAAPSDNQPENAAAADEKPAAPQPAAQPATPVEVGPVPSMDERIQQLQAKAGETDAQIAEAQKEVDRLSAAAAEVKGKLDKARAQADAANKRMMELEDAGVDAADPSAIKRFTEQYNQAARSQREASREADAFEYGALRNARPDAQEENEILTAPMVPAKPGQKITPEPGLVALEADLRAAKALVETSQALRKQIDAQIKVFETRRDQLKADLAKAESWRASLAKEATARAQAAIAEAIQAEKLENEGIALIADQGIPAAERAQSAATKRGSEVQDFHRKQMAGSPQTGFMAGHAQAVAGDLELERALLLAQQADALRRHEPMLAVLVQMGIDPAKLATTKADGEASGEAAVPPVGTPTTQPQAIAQAAEAARTKALEAAKAALKLYEDASGQLNRLWLVHTQMAAVHYLMASLTTGDEAQKHQADAAKEYQLATRDRPDRPETKAYRFVTEAPQ